MLRATNIPGIMLSNCFSGGSLCNFRWDLLSNLLALQDVYSKCKYDGEASDCRLSKILTLLVVGMGSVALVVFCL